MAETTSTGQGTQRTGASDVRAAIESAGKAKDESDDSSDDDTSDDDESSDDDSEGDDDGSDTTDDDTNNSDDASGDDEGDDDEGDENSDESKAQSKSYKYQQYVGDGKPETYISNLEKAHQSSITSAVQLQTDLNTATGRVDAIMRAAASDPDLAKRLNEIINKDGSGTEDGGDEGSAISNPFVADMEAQWREKSTKEIDEFIEANPEVATDPKIAKDVQYWMGVFSQQHQKRTGRLLSGGEAMAQAYRHLGLENKLDKQTLAAGVKKTAAHTRPRGKVKKSTGQKPKFTDAQIAMAKSMGKDEKWLTQNAK